MTVRCTSTHKMEVDGFVLFVRNDCQDGTKFVGVHSFDRKAGKYIVPGFSNAGGYVGSVYFEFEDGGKRYVGTGSGTDPMTGEAIGSKGVAEPTDEGYVFQLFLVRSDGTEVLLRRETYTRTK